MEAKIEGATPRKVGGPHRQQRFNFVALTVAVLVAAMGLGYLVAIPLGWIDPDNRRLSAPETVLFGAILVFTLMLLLITGPGLEGFSVSGKGFDFRLRKVQDEVTSLRFLLSHFLSEKQLAYLIGLASTDGHSYDFSGTDGGWYKRFFKSDLRHLRSLGLITMRSGKTIEGLPDKGNLFDDFRITDRGQEYLNLRKEVEADR
jgi:hypothetical protein